LQQKVTQFLQRLNFLYTSLFCFFTRFMFKYSLRYFIFLLNRFQTFLTFHFRGLTSFFLFVFITFFREKYCCQTITPSWVKDEKIDRSKQKKSFLKKTWII
jgi:hypothetical protein